MNFKENLRKLERIAKGFANHRRIEILGLLKTNPELSLFEISEESGINLKTASEHVRRLSMAGLVVKRSAGRSVKHKLTDRGHDVLTFLRMLE